MAEVNNTPTINSSELGNVITNSLQLDQLMRTLHHGESGLHRGIGAGRHPGGHDGPGGRGGGFDGVDISRDIVQGWLDEGKLTLREEPASGAASKLYGSPAAFLEKHGLTDPRKQ